jgi:hypothetical protein
MLESLFVIAPFLIMGAYLLLVMPWRMWRRMSAKYVDPDYCSTCGHAACSTCGARVWGDYPYA